MIRGRKQISVLVTMLLVLPMIFTAPVYATPDGDVSGEFSVNSPPIVDSVSLNVTSMTPLTEYTVSVQVTDNDSIDHLDTVIFKAWYDSNGGSPAEVEFDAQSANVTNCAVITWTHTGGTGSTTIFTPASTTWSSGNCTVPSTVGDFNGTTFEFQFVFTVGKIATETTGSALWQIAAKATDDQSTTGWNSDDEGASMDFYGEITVPSTTVTWDTLLTPGTDFTDPGAQEAVGIIINYIANGDYAKDVRSISSWSGTSYTADLDATGNCSGAQQFALSADDDDTFADSVVIDTTGVSVDDTGTQTSESGDDVSNMNLWIKIASSFSGDDYTGTITYVVVNR